MYSLFSLMGVIHMLVFLVCFIVPYSLDNKQRPVFRSSTSLYFDMYFTAANSVTEQRNLGTPP
jgi:hypothetical protein